MTAWRSPIFAIVRATRAGSSGAFHGGLPVFTLQKPQRRVHVSPRIMNVAVPRSQHSPTFGQAASWQTVWRFSLAMRAVSSRYFAPPGAGTLNHGGLRSRIGRTSGPRTLSTSIPPGLARERVESLRSSADIAVSTLAAARRGAEGGAQNRGGGA